MKRPLALILCKFTDVPQPSVPVSTFKTLMEPGSSGLYDYWYDVTKGQLSIAGSAVFGWWTMQYDYATQGSLDRQLYIDEARRLASANNVDLSPFFGIIAFCNATVDGGNKGGTDMVASLVGSRGQQNEWRWCNKCQALGFRAAGVGPCPAGSKHDYRQSADYLVSFAGSAGVIGQNNWRWCQKCFALNYGGANPSASCPANGVHDNSGSGDYTLPFAPTARTQADWKLCSRCGILVYTDLASGSCAAIGPHNTSASSDYALSSGKSDLNVTNIAHETGHGFGLRHSWSSEPEFEYRNPWDIMSAMTVKSAGDDAFSPTGPGLQAPHFDCLGLLPSWATWTWPANAGGGQLQLLAINNQSDASLPLGLWAAKFNRAERTYYVEFRTATGWDRAYPRSAVFVNELRTFRWCRKCQQLVAAASGVVGPCPAGTSHDVTNGSNYLVLRNTLPDGDGNKLLAQIGWQWCNKCQALTYSGAPGVCVDGSDHNHQGSQIYAVVFDPKYPPLGGQGGWRWCSSCGALNFAASEDGSCAAGRQHSNALSAEYSLRIDGSNPSIGNPFLLGNAEGIQDLQPGMSFVTDDAGIGVAVHSFGGTASQPTATVTIGDVQNQWRWCLNCQGLAYAGGAPGICPSGGGQHDHTTSADYYLFHDVAGTSGQDQWRWCSRCQGLVYGRRVGVCPADGGPHQTQGYDYVLFYGDTMTDAQDNWRWCSKCQGLAYAALSPSVCPAGGSHATASANYNLLFRRIPPAASNVGSEVRHW